MPNLVVKGRQTLKINSVKDFSEINKAMGFIKSSSYTCAKVNYELLASGFIRIIKLAKLKKPVERSISVTIATDAIDIYLSGENVTELKSLAIMLLNESKTLLRYSSDGISRLGKVSTTETKINRYLNSQVTQQCPFEIMRFLKVSLNKKDILELTP